MRITFILPCLDMSGGNRIVSMYARLASSAGHVVRVIVAGPRPIRFKTRLRNLVRAWQAPAPTVPQRSHFDGLAVNVTHLEQYRELHDDDLPDADVLIATWWETAEWVAKLSPRKGSKVYLVQHHEIFDEMHADRVRATYRLPLHKIVVAPWLADLMQSEYSDPSVDLVLNATDPKEFWAPVRGKQPFPTIGFMYASNQFKGSDIAAATLRHLDQSVANLRVVSFGRETPEGTAHLGDRFSYVRDPSSNQIREAYACCDAWLMSSRSEGFGLPALEAMACRTPLVSTRMGWPSTAVIDGFNGYLADVDDAQGLADGLRRVLQASPGAWNALSANAADTASQLTWDQSFPLFIAALERARSRQLRLAA